MSTTPASPAETSTWNIDPIHSTAEFKVRQLMISNVKGTFPKLSGVLTLDESNPANSSVEASIDVASIETRDAQRDAHLKSADFFDVEKFPAMTFHSTKVTATGPGEGTVEGNLTIRDQTHPAVFHVEGPSAAAKDPWAERRNIRLSIEPGSAVLRRPPGFFEIAN